MERDQGQRDHDHGHDQRRPQGQDQDQHQLVRHQPRRPVSQQARLYNLIVQACRRIIELQTGSTELVEILAEAGNSLSIMWRLAVGVYRGLRQAGRSLGLLGPGVHGPADQVGVVVVG